MVRRSVCGWLLVFICLAGCSRQRTGTTDPEAKLRLERILEAYQAYISDNRTGPPDEAAFLAYLRTLPADKKKSMSLPDDLDALLTSPRDGQKYVIRYKIASFHEGQPRPVAWEQTGQGGMRWVALSMGYVEEYDEEYLNELKKRK
jgi:hypothetical protein